jgi:nicotinamidase-related amidase
LKSKNVRKLVVAGLQTEYCVDTTCRRAYSLGYEVVLVRDAHRTWDSGNLSASQIIDHYNKVLVGWFATLKDEKDVSF